MIHVGYNNYIAKDKVVAVVDCPAVMSSPIKRSLHIAQDKDMHIDMTMGRKTRAVVFMSTGHIVTTWREALTIANRANKEGNNDE